MIARILGLVWLAYTAPAFNSMLPHSPNTSGEPCTNLRSVRIYAWPKCDPSMRSDCGWVIVDDAFAQPGQAMQRSVWLPWSEPTSLMARGVSYSGNESPIPHVVLGVQIPTPEVKP